MFLSHEDKFVCYPVTFKFTVIAILLAEKTANSSISDTVTNFIWN